MPPIQVLKHYVLRKENGVYQFRNGRTYSSAVEMIEEHRKNRWPLDSQVPTSVIITPVARQPWELSHKNILKGEKLGEGQFGDVHRGSLKLRQGNSVPVAIKSVGAISSNFSSCRHTFR